MNIFDDFQRRLAAIIARLGSEGALPAGLDASKVVVEPPRDPSHGDLATNAAMVLAKEAKSNPRALAGLIQAELAREPGVVSAEIAGPGFINIRLDVSMFQDVVRAIVSSSKDFGRIARTSLEKVNVEYVSANPTGPMHVGHGRGAVFGDALANLLAFAGQDVTREYYINDAGAQVDVLARSAFLRYREALGENVGSIPEGLYPGDYLVPVGQKLAAEHGRSLLDKPEAEWLPLVRQVAIDMMMDMIRADLALLNISHEVFFSERSLSKGAVDEIKATIDELRSRDLVYEGRLPPPKGQPVEDWEDREQTLFRATAFGDDVDRPLLKSDGSYTYFASDIAYHASKFRRGFKTMIDVWGADHGGYVKRMAAAVKAVTAGQGELDVKLCQLVRLLRNGEPVKMSKRAGDFVTLRDVVDEVGRDPVRFMMLFRKNDATLDFDLAKVIEQSKENPVFYVQYAHARCKSVFRQAEQAFAGAANDRAALLAADLKLLSDSAELDVIRRLSQFPRIVEASASAHEPHRVAFYLYDLASDFHGLWNRGKEAPHLRFVIETDRNSSYARLALVDAVMSVLAAGLGILGVTAPDEMR
ncbi:arginine--tRNA ligase [Alsobacter soli]|uniref:Arginine--tRNA ligase n=1 Tax=Alsobacter soli TaxID=2109933 RepID=A0A2T1HMA2_9HYPH|nr:arginine--tRNA ligase [Alsobacter soli]PSC02766.1 arginine--tRNA ligase [Alsobacter soli]